MRLQWSASIRSVGVWHLVCCVLLLFSNAAGRRSADPPTLSLVGLGLEASERLKRDALDDFVRKSGIQVEVVPAWGTSAEQLVQTTRLLSKPTKPPDIYVIDVIWPGVLGPDLL